MFTKKTTLLLALGLLYIFGIAHGAEAACGVKLTQTLSTTWTSNDGTFSLVQVTMNNQGTSAVKALTLNSDSDFQSFWEMNTISKGEIVLPDWRIGAGIEVGATHSWGYIIKSNKAADLSVTSVECVDGSVSQPTQAPPATQAPATEAPTRAPSTQAPTKAPTTAPTRRPTAAPTTRPTSRPSTQAPTRAPSTQAPTKAPTTAPTTKPTTPATAAPTTKPGSNTNGRICPDGQIWAPAPGTTWQWQLTGTIDQSFNVQMYDIDLFDASASVISQLHQKNRVVICYFSTQYEDWRPDAKSFTSAILGANLDDWPGERYVDIRSPVLRAIMAARLDLAKSKGCDGVEPDNVDGYTNKNGLGLTAADQLDYNKYLAQQAHARGLSIGLKNDLDQVNQLVSYFDWALNEQCNQYGECNTLTPFVNAGKAVFGVEYSGSTSSFCPKMNTAKFSWLLKSLSLGAPLTQCCASASGGCQQAAFKCVAPNQRRSEYAEAFTPDAELEAIEAALAPNPFEEEIVEQAELVAENVELVEPEAIAQEFVAEPVEDIVA